MKNMGHYLIWILFILFNRFPAYSQPQPLSITKINNQLYQISGGGSNSYFYISNYEVVVIDAKIGVEYARQMLEKIREITEKPVRYLLITHHDGDHSRGIPVFEPPVNIFIHDNAFIHLQELEQNSNLILKNLNIIHFRNNITIKLSNDELELYYFGPAHTDGDIVVYIPKYKTAVVGDLYLNDVNTFVKSESGGNFYNLETALLRICQLDIEYVLSGHNDLSTKEDLLQVLNYFIKIRTLVSQYINEGKSLEETLESISFSQFKDEAGYNTEESFRQNIIDFYLGIKKERTK